MKSIRQYGMVIALVAISLVSYFWTRDHVAFKPLNVTNILTQNSYVMILAIGMVVVIIARHIDLSVGSVAAFVGAVAAVMMTEWNIPWVLAVILCLVLGAAIGAWHGFWVAYMEIPAFIVTLSSMLIFRGLTMVMLGSETKGNLPTGFQRLFANGFIPHLFTIGKLKGSTLLIGALLSAYLVYAELRKRSSARTYGFAVSSIFTMIAKLVLMVGAVMWISWIIARYRGLPWIGFLIFILIGIYTFITTRTVTGRHVYAIGGNYAAANMTGIRTKKTDILVLANMGMLAAVAGLAITARLTAANPKAGDGFELDAIAACFIGGAAVSGGVGTVTGAMIGAIFMGVLNNMMSLKGWGPEWQKVAKGAVLLLAVAFDVWNKRRAAGSRKGGTAAVGEAVEATVSDQSGTGSAAPAL